MQKVYIAGPGVFSPSAVKIGQNFKEICRKYNFIGLYPLDNEGELSSAEIFKANKRRIDEADFVVADINFFRGQTMDDGTAWEIGYAYAKNKIIYCYTEDVRDLRTKIGDLDSEGFLVEDFKHPINLMIYEAADAVICGSFEQCIKQLAQVHH